MNDPSPFRHCDHRSKLAKCANHTKIQFVLNDLDHEIRQRFIDLGGRSAQRLGLPRSLGQIYAVLYLSPRPMSLQDLMEALHISKGNASMGVRQLKAWSALDQIWVKGDRRDYYQANPDFRNVLKNLLSVLIKPRLESTSRQLEEMQNLSPARPREGSDTAFIRDRLAKLHRFESKIRKIIPLAEKLL
jgi:HTH-type transcriptional regulator, glycine betaine synthesis regulator